MFSKLESSVGTAKGRVRLQTPSLAMMSANVLELQVYEVDGNDDGGRHTVYVVAFTKVTFMETLKSPVRSHTRAFGEAWSCQIVCAVKLLGGSNVVQMSTSIVSTPSEPGLQSTGS